MLRRNDVHGSFGAKGRWEKHAEKGIQALSVGAEQRVVNRGVIIQIQQARCDNQ